MGLGCCGMGPRVPSGSLHRSSSGPYGLWSAAYVRGFTCPRVLANRPVRLDVVFHPQGVLCMGPGSCVDVLERVGGGGLLG